jgi:hypothetical protein
MFLSSGKKEERNLIVRVFLGVVGTREKERECFSDFEVYFYHWARSTLFACKIPIVLEESQ